MSFGAKKTPSESCICPQASLLFSLGWEWLCYKLSCHVGTIKRETTVSIITVPGTCSLAHIGCAESDGSGEF